MGWVITLIIFFLFALLPLGFRVVYREGGPRIWVLIGLVNLKIFPLNSRKKKTSVKEKKTSKETAKNTSSSKQSKTAKGGSYKDFLPIVQTIINFLGHFRRKIRVNHLELKILLAGGNPCDLAVNYGKAWIALGNLMPQLERIFVIKNRNLEVECDFSGDKTLVYARADVTITLCRTIHLLTWHGLKVLKQLLQLKKLQKGGASL